MKKPELVIFDVDGLLLNTEYLWIRANDIVADMYHLPELRKDIFKEKIGLTGESYDEIVIRELQAYDNPRQYLSLIRETGLKLIGEELELLPGAIALLDYLEAEGIQKTIATSTGRRLTEDRLRRMGILSRFSCILCGDDVRHRKPDPEIFVKTAELFPKIPRERILILEDSIHGVEGAWRAGIPYIMVPSVQKPGENEYERAAAVADNLFIVKRILESISDKHE